MHIIQVECMFVDMKQSTDVVVLLNLELFPPPPPRFVFSPVHQKTALYFGEVIQGYPLLEASVAGFEP